MDIISFLASPVVDVILYPAIGLALGEVARRTYRHYGKTRPARKIWDLSGDAYVVIESPPSFAKDEYVYTSYPATYAAIVELQRFFAMYFKETNLHIYNAEDFPTSHHNENLIIFGGPVHNQVSKRMLEKLQPSVGFEGFDTVHKPSGDRHSARIENEKIVEDFGIVVARKNPFNREKRVLIFAGSRVYGNLGAARALFFPTLSEVRKVTHSKTDFDLIVGVDVIGEFVGQTRLLYPKAS